jgi:hypothetical protein
VETQPVTLQRHVKRVIRRLGGFFGIESVFCGRDVLEQFEMIL